VVKTEKLLRSERGQTVSATVIIDEFDFEGVGVMDVHDGAHLAAKKAFRGHVGGERHDIQFPDQLIGHLTPL
jgi:hypothetical protein